MGQTPSVTHRESSGPVRVRRYRTADRAEVLALDEEVWGRRRTDSWLAWKYERNPYLDHTPMFVAEADDRIVGARPFLAFQLRVGGRNLLALQPSDTMVHPEYRGRGIFTAMTEAALSHYDDSDVALYFNFPNGMAAPGYRKLGWREVSERRTYYRVQNPVGLAAERAGVGALGRLLPDLDDRVVVAFARMTQGDGTLGDGTLRSGESKHDDLTVECVDGIQPETLASLYLRNVPFEIHARRDRAFYRWRFDSPSWRRRTYLARRDGDPVAALVARSRTTTAGIVLTQLAEVAPLRGDDVWIAALDRILSHVLDDHADSDVLADPDSPIPSRLLTARGFLANDRPPLSWARRHRRGLYVRSAAADDVADPDWTIDGYRLADPKNWRLTFAERDTT